MSCMPCASHEDARSSEPILGITLSQCYPPLSDKMLDRAQEFGSPTRARMQYAAGRH
ncbi:Hypothetical protein H16_B2028 [Cupriavidus necator H16]|uniref:Uncharacterized protein n=1 Tax=Cupriavidus necator (strain ATCC 17699 / DSM 428 / KCTC 22496 / NCIMB 10442 / H16 / Stanier 337) TaxID=381666 RepID=Q0JZL4_CUPNH|nr:Hypothetical protein H16_B2028 [Cupriavidus necator H16]